MPSSIVLFGATGAVGSRVAHAIVKRGDSERLTLPGRRALGSISDAIVEQHVCDIHDPKSYASVLPGHDCAICTLGVGEPSKISREEFLRIDKIAVLAFATECRRAGIEHFQLLSSVGVGADSRSFFLRSKGELEDGLRALEFDRLSLFHPSMILTPSNRYGFSQAITLALWPLMTPILQGPLRKFRGIPVDRLAQAIAANAFLSGRGEETLEWDDCMTLSSITR